MKTGFIFICMLLTLTTFVFSGSRKEAQGMQSEPVKEVKFPLAEKTTYNLMMNMPKDINNYVEKIEFLKWLEAKTNVHFEFTFLGNTAAASLEKLTLLFASGDYTDAVFGGMLLNESQTAQFGSAGVLIPLNQYMENKSIMPLLNSRIFAESPQTKGYVTCPDGNIYTLPGYNNLPGNYLESPIWINKKWLDNLGLKVPATLNELTETLRAFKQKDANGNGNPNDEIPYIAREVDPFGHLESLLGMWGLATKGSALDSFVTVRNGKVYFVPVMDDFKTAMHTYQTWYKEGLLWNECLTGTVDSFNSRLTNPNFAIVGMHTLKTLPSIPYSDEYIRILPPKVDGYKTSWYRHPGALGGRGTLLITNKCKNPEFLLGAMDFMYDLDATVRIQYGEQKDGRWKTDNGKYGFISLPADLSAKLNEEAPPFGYFTNNRLYAWTANDYANNVVLSGMQKIYAESYDLYKDIMTNEIWPRPYFTPEDAQRTNELRTDIFNTTTQMRGRWISGQADIEATWNEYKANLDRMGLQEYIGILQKAYDVFNTSMK